jgi:plasmid stabilization system protein ParE
LFRLIDVWEYISCHNPDAADRYVRQLRERARQLLAHPELGRRRDEVATGVRGLVFHNHILSKERLAHGVMA